MTHIFLLFFIFSTEKYKIRVGKDSKEQEEE